MTLLEILVRELPKRGGWPNKYNVAHTDGGLFKIVFAGPNTLNFAAPWSEGVDISNGDTLITREHYEAALAAVEPEWNGEGLPPVGRECEIKRVADWMPVTIKFISTYHTVFTTFGGTEDCYQTCSLQFRPIRSEADRKRDEASSAMHKEWRAVAGKEYANGQLIDIYSAIYQAIAAGKIPHLKIV